MQEIRDLDYQLAAEQDLLRALLQAFLLNAYAPGPAPHTLDELHEQVLGFVAAGGAQRGIDNDRLDQLVRERIANLFRAVERGILATTESKPAAALVN